MKNAYIMTYACLTSWLEYGVEHHTVFTGLLTGFVIWWLFL